jgi:hypothetical protein
MSICWSSAAVCNQTPGEGILQADGRPSGSYQVLLGKHGRPAGTCCAAHGLPLSWSCCCRTSCLRQQKNFTVTACSGTNKQKSHSVLVSRRSLLSRFNALKDAVDAVADDHSLSGGGQAPCDRGEHETHPCSDDPSTAVRDFNAHYRAIKFQYAKVYMDAWSALLRTAVFAHWLCGNALPQTQRRDSAHSVVV